MYVKWCICGNENSVGASNPSDEPFSKPKKRETVGWLNNLLNRIRSSTISKTGDEKHKVKKLHLKYERYDHINEVFKNVRVKDGGRPRFVKVICNQPITFREIRVKGEELHFDVNNCNEFNEKNTDCLIHIYHAADNPLDENENLWTYIQRKSIFLSKTAFMIKSKLLFTDVLFEEAIEVRGGNTNSMLMNTNFA